MKECPEDLTMVKTLDSLRSWAKTLKRQAGITHTEALEQVARRAGHANWEACRRAMT